MPSVNRIQPRSLRWSASLVDAAVVQHHHRSERLSPRAGAVDTFNPRMGRPSQLRTENHRGPFDHDALSMADPFSATASRPTRIRLAQAITLSPVSLRRSVEPAVQRAT